MSLGGWATARKRTGKEPSWFSGQRRPGPRKAGKFPKAASTKPSDWKRTSIRLRALQKWTIRCRSWIGLARTTCSCYRRATRLLETHNCRPSRDQRPLPFARVQRLIGAHLAEASKMSGQWATQLHENAGVKVAAQGRQPVVSPHPCGSSTRRSHSDASPGHPAICAARVLIELGLSQTPDALTECDEPDTVMARILLARAGALGTQYPLLPSTSDPTNFMLAGLYHAMAHSAAG
jgi:hypothetical protein